MLEISYGGYTFPSPLPFVGLEDNHVFLSGQIDHVKQNISLIGEITGCSLELIKETRDEMVFAISSGFQYLSIGNTGYSYSKPTKINFPSSQINKRLPYEIEFEGYFDRDFSQFFGVENPTDTWSFSEQNNRRISATHSVSAKGIKVSAQEPLVSARDFVNGRLNGFDESKSLFFSGSSFILKDKSEEVNRAENSYGVNEVYELSNSPLSNDRPDSIVRANCQITYDGESDLQVSVNGTIEGGISGSADTGYFTPQMATEFAKNTIERSKTNYEESLYGNILKDPQTYNYDIDTGSNSINFTFSFVDPTDARTGDVLHDYSTSLSASKQDGFVSINLNGSLRYNSTRDIFSTQSPESEARFQKVEEAFSGVNQFSIAQDHFSLFNDGSLNYSELPLNESFKTLTINKLPHASEINYAYSYSNKPDQFSGLFQSINLTVQTNHPTLNYGIEETTDGNFSVQPLYDTLERKTITLNGDLSGDTEMNQAISYLNNWVLQYSGQSSFLSTDSIQTGSNSLSFTKSFVIK